MNIKYFFYFL